MVFTVLIPSCTHCIPPVLLWHPQTVHIKRDSAPKADQEGTGICGLLRLCAPTEERPTRSADLQNTLLLCEDSSGS